MSPFRRLGPACAIALFLLPASANADPRAVAFKQEDGKVQILLRSRPFATYVFNDDKIGRPYFAHLHAPNGRQVTRHHPPRPGIDAGDHATMHPGLWLAFGDIGGHDTWRNQARVVQDKLLIGKPVFADRDSFTVHNLYFAKGAKKPFVREESRYTFILLQSHYLMIWQAKLFPLEGELRFGDQEEMGLGVRVATDLTVKNGGRILTSDGKKNEKEARGATPKWCEYSGVVKDQRVGVTLLIDETNIQPTFMHVRDYGLMVANMFGRKTFTGKASTSPILRPPSFVPLRYGLCTFAVGANEEPSAAIYQRFQQELDRP